MPGRVGANHWAATAVFEQGASERKKQYVLEWLLSHNIKVDEDKLDAMIESAVYALKGTLAGVVKICS